MQRVITNIVTNSVTAMNGRGIIRIRTLYEFGKIVIKIQNDGPKIDKKILKDIFKAGVSTKKDTDGNHGFGLVIVKEIIDKYSGRIEIFTDINETEFKIIMPMRVRIEIFTDINETEFKIIMPMRVEENNINNYNNINSQSCN